VSDYLFLVPISLLMGLLALAAFFWTLRSDQYDDLDGAAERVLVDEDRPLPPPDTESDANGTPSRSTRRALGGAPAHEEERAARR